MVHLAELQAADGVAMAGVHRGEEAYKRLIWFAENAGTFSAFSSESSNENTREDAVTAGGGASPRGSGGWVSTALDSRSIDSVRFADRISMEGCEAGSTEGCEEGWEEGSSEGCVGCEEDGSPDGSQEGLLEDSPEGSPEGSPEDLLEGSPEGLEDGGGGGGCVGWGGMGGWADGSPEGWVDAAKEDSGVAMGSAVEEASVWRRCPLRPRRFFRGAAIAPSSPFPPSSPSEAVEAFPAFAAFSCANSRRRCCCSSSRVENSTSPMSSRPLSPSPGVEVTGVGSSWALPSPSWSLVRDWCDGGSRAEFSER